METLTAFHFLRPGWLLALPAVLYLWWYLRRPASTDSPWRWICDEALLSQLLVLSQGHRRSFWWLLGFAWVTCVLALAGPTWEQRALPVFQNMDARVIVLDLSLSMGSTDLRPSRISRARFKVADILEATEEGQVGLVVYAGDAFVVSPLTQDTNTVQSMVPVLDPNIMPSQGSRLDLGLLQAEELLLQAGQDQGHILVISDSVDARALDVAEQLLSRGYLISTLGVGTPGGAPIPMGQGFLRNSLGEMVVPSLDTEGLQHLAQTGGGRFTMMTPDNTDLATLLSDDLPGDADTQQVDRETDSWREEGPWLVLALLPIAALAFRRGWLLAIALLVLTPQSRAMDWTDLWQRPDQQAASLLDTQQFNAAAQATDDPLWRGTAHYRAGDFEASLADFSQVRGAVGHYNQGNALAQLGRLEEAIAAYDEALGLNPQMDDARHNRELLEKLLRQQQQQQQQQQRDQEGENQGDPNQQGSPQSSNQSGEPQGNTQNPQDGEQMGNSDEQQDGEQQELEAEMEPQEGEPEGPPQGQTPSVEETLSQEEQQALEQWLRRIPDDPGGLLRRKFRHLCNERGDCQDATRGAW